MTTSALAGVASDTSAASADLSLDTDIVPDGDTTEEPPLPTTAYIVGFAPSWVLTPWGDTDAHFWGMNALHKIAAEKPWTHWFQLHDIDKHHTEDRDEHVKWMSEQPYPVMMFEEHAQNVIDELPNLAIYPRDEVLKEFGNYFTNTVSWQIALAILMGYKRIGIYGVDMAQDAEYGGQRPSCEWMIGVAQGRGIEVDIPGTSDLLKTPYLYGIEDGGVMRVKYDARMKELIERRQDLERQRNMAHEALLQVVGAIENTEYFRRVWSQEEGKGSTA